MTARLLKWGMWVVIGLIVIVGVALAVTQTGIFRDWVKNKIETAVNESVNGRLEIGTLDGNLFTRAELSDLGFFIGPDTIATIERIDIRYDLWPLFSGIIQLDSLSMDSPTLYLSQDSANVWNITRVVPLESSDVSADPDESQFDYEVIVGAFSLNRGRIQLTSTERLIPRAIDSINVEMSGRYTESHQTLNLQTFNFCAREPQFVLSQLSFDLERTARAISISNFDLKTSENSFAASGEYAPADSVRSQAAVLSKPIAFEEFAFVMPDIKIIANPTITLSTNLRQDSLALDLLIVEGNQSLGVVGYVANISSLLDSAATDIPRYGATIRLSRVDPRGWLSDPPFDFRASGEIAITGEGREVEKINGVLTARLQDCVVDNRPISDFRIDASYKNGNVDGKLSVVAGFGRINVTAKVADLLGVRRTVANGTMSALNVARIIGDDSLQSDLNAKFDIDVTGKDPSTLKGRAALVMSRSSFTDISVDTLETSFGFANGRATIDTIYLATEAFDVRGKGVVDTALFFDGNLAIELGDLGILSSYVEADSLAGSGVVSGAISGTMSAFTGDVAFNLNDLTYNAVKVKKVIGYTRGVIDSTDYRLSGSLRATQLMISDFGIDSAVTDYSSTSTESHASFDLWQSDSLSASGAVAVAVDSTIAILLEKLNLHLKQQAWASGRTSRIVVAGDDYEIDSLLLVGPPDKNGKAQQVLIDGTLSLTGREDLSLEIAHMDVAALGVLLDLPYTLSGSHSMRLSLTGTASEPIVSGWGKIVRGQIADYAYDSLYGDVQYSDGNLTAMQTLVPNEAGTLHIQAALQMHLSLTDTLEMISPDAELDLFVMADSMSLAVLKAVGQHIEHVTGVLDGRLAVTNTISAPIFQGRMAMRNAAFTIPLYGIDYRDVTVSVSFDSTDIRLDTLLARRDKGIVTGGGKLSLKDDVLSGMVKSSEFQFDAKDFYVVQHKDYEVQISGNAGLSGTPDEAKYNGIITVNRSRIYLPALTEVNGTAASADPKGLPMLVKATRPDTMIVDSIGVVPLQAADSIEQYAAMYENLRGSLKLRFPRNSWIRSDEMRLEIGGELDIVKEGRDPELFGTVRVIRGHYDLYGRRFNIKEGQLVFQGGIEFDPNVSLEAAYTFRTAEREKKTLTLYVSGRASLPEIRFELDNRAVPEGDAVAYLLFGRSFDQLTSGQRTEVGGGSSETDVAKRIAANFVSNKISQTIGQQLNLDVIEIKAQENLSAATLTVGKYLTSDLFVSYQRGIGSIEDNDIARELVTLEYEILRFLFLQLIEGDSRESGADVIFKFEF